MTVDSRYLSNKNRLEHKTNYQAYEGVLVVAGEVKMQLNTLLKHFKALKLKSGFVHHSTSFWAGKLLQLMSSLLFILSRVSVSDTRTRIWTLRASAM